MNEPKLALFICIDALSWEILSRSNSFLTERIIDKKPLKSILGSSKAGMASIISGLKPIDHRLWADYFYSPQTSPFKKLKWLSLFPSSLMDWGSVRINLAEQVKKWCEIKGDFNLYQIPFEIFPNFDYAGKNPIWTPGGLQGAKTIFDHLKEFDINWFCDDSTESDEDKIRLLKRSISEQKISFAFLKLNGLESLMREVGTNHPKVDALMNWYSTEIESLLIFAQKYYEEAPLYIFSNQAMQDVVGSVDLICKIKMLGLEEGIDYAMIVESTMARFWFLSDEAGKKIKKCLLEVREGRILSDLELKSEGVYISDHKFGDCIFIVNAGLVISPNYWDKGLPIAVSVCDPKIKGSALPFCSSQTIPAGVRCIDQIFPLMLEEMHLPIPKEMELSNG
jgi:hypothetical protein